MSHGICDKQELQCVLTRHSGEHAARRHPPEATGRIAPDPGKARRSRLLGFAGGQVALMFCEGRTLRHPGTSRHPDPASAGHGPLTGRHVREAATLLVFGSPT